MICDRTKLQILQTVAMKLMKKQKIFVVRCCDLRLVNAQTSQSESEFGERFEETVTEIGIRDGK